MAAALSDDGAAEAQVSHAACHQALDTVELLEEILTHLPTKDLLFAQRICRQWKNCIDNSKRLQQGLFLRAPGNRDPVDLATKRLEHVALLLEESETKTHFNYLKFMTINPLMHAQFGADGLSKLTTHPGHLCRSDEAYLRPEASWRRMIRSYPVIKTNEDDRLRKLIRDFWIDDSSNGLSQRPLVLAAVVKDTEDSFCHSLTKMYERMPKFETTDDLERYWAAAERTDSKTSN